MRTTIALLALVWAGVASATETIDANALYQQHCSACHGATRLGQMGPALLPGNLKRLRQHNAADIIRDGLPATQMPSFAEQLSDEHVAALVDFIYMPPDKPPTWDAADISASQIILEPDLVKTDAQQLPPVYAADPLNLFLVVEAGDHHVTVLDGDKLEPIHRFKSRFALHGGPKYTADGRYVYFASRDGWISKFDMYRLKTVAEIRAGINTRNAAVSADGRYVMVGNYLPHTLVVLDALDLTLVEVIPVREADGRSSRVSAVYSAPPRDSFVVAMKEFKQIWEVREKPLNSDRGKTNSRFSVRKIKLDNHLDDFFFDQSYQHVIGASRSARSGQVVSLVEGRMVTDLNLAGMPHLGSGITWPYTLENGEQTTVLATPHFESGDVSVIDMKTWKTLKQIKTKGPGFFMRSHENSRYAWVDVFFGPHKDLMHVIDKQSLSIVKTLQPSPGKTSAHVEFTRDGRFALVSVWDMNGEIVVYDARTLEEAKRLPMRKPVGKYNVYNKITRSEGTSH